LEEAKLKLFTADFSGAQAARAVAAAQFAAAAVCVLKCVLTYADVC
jgi:hypothetical protein